MTTVDDNILCNIGIHLITCSLGLMYPFILKCDNHFAMDIKIS